MKCKVCQVETPRRIRCGALVCEACKRFFMRQKRQHPNGKGIKCKHGNDQCLKEVQEQKAKVTQRGWFWRGMCAACRFKKCVQVGMKYQRKQLAPNESKSLSSSSTSSVIVEDFAVDDGTQQELTPDVNNINYQWLFDFSEQMKRQQLQQAQQQEKIQVQYKVLVTLLANQYLSQYLNEIVQGSMKLNSH